MTNMFAPAVDYVVGSGPNTAYYSRFQSRQKS